MKNSRKIAIGAGTLALVSLLVCGGLGYYVLGREAVALGDWSGSEPLESEPFEAQTGNFIVLVSTSDSGRITASLKDAGGVLHDVVSETVNGDSQRIYNPSLGPGTYRLVADSHDVAWSVLVKEWRR